jgi:TetR/AcrR family transcriptional regulator, mexJK operon transcriptional repressor
MVAAADTRTGRKRASILSAAEARFLQKGFKSTSVDEVAALAEVSKQTIYKQFGSKHRLLEAVVSACLQRAGGPVLDQIAALAQTTDLRADLHDVALNYLKAVLAEPVVQLRRLVIAEAGEMPDLADVYYRQAVDRTLDSLARSFGLLDKRGVLRVPDTSMAAEHFAFLIVGKSIDRALFFGSPQMPPRKTLATAASSGVAVFLAAYENSGG